MTEFNPSVVEMFFFRVSAERYAQRARWHGYRARVQFQGSNWWQLGGRWGVVISEVWQ